MQIWTHAHLILWFSNVFIRHAGLACTHPHSETPLPACLLKIRMQAHTQTCIVLVAGSLRHAEFIKFCIDKPLAGTAAAFKSSQQVAASSCFHPPSHQVYIICIVHMEASRHYKVKREMGISSSPMLQTDSTFFCSLAALLPTLHALPAQP